MKILVCCSTGMSSSIAVKTLREAAKTKGLDYRFLAVCIGQIEMYLSEADIVLVAPQSSMEAERIKTLEAASGKPVITLTRDEYGNNDTREILKKINSADIKGERMEHATTNILEKHLMLSW